MKLEELWERYGSFGPFNIGSLPESIRSQGTRIVFPPRSVIVNRGDFPRYIYFVERGVALGTRNYNDGNNYYYFQIDRENGCLGLLEVLSRQPATVATVVARTEVTVLRVNSAVIYEFIMNSPKLLAQCVYMVAGDLYQRSGNDGILYYYRGIDRVRYYLVQYCGLHGRGDGEVWVDADYQTIASNIGVSIRTVVRSIRTLKEQGEITSVRKKISISPDQYQTMLDAILPLLHS